MFESLLEVMVCFVFIERQMPITVSAAMNNPTTRMSGFIGVTNEINIAITAEAAILML